jgi:hypothetical protein
MALSLALSVLVTRCRQRARRENDDSISPAEWKSLISELYGEMHAAVVDTGSRYFAQTATIVANGSASYALPSDHRETFEVARVLDSAGTRAPLDEIMFQERDLFIGQTGDAVAYEIEGATIILYPKPSTGSYAHVYCPQPTDLSAAADATSVDVITSDGLSFLLWGVSVLARDKEESDLIAAIKHRDDAKDRLIAWASKHRSALRNRRPVAPDSDMTDYDPADWRFRH